MIRRACAAAALFAASIGVPAHADDVFAVDPFERGWFGFIVDYAGETGPELDVRSVKLGFVFRGGWGEFQYAPWSFLDVNGRPADVSSEEFGPIEPALRYTGPWRLAPFFEVRNDLLRGLFDPNAGSRVDRALGLRYQLDRHWQVELYLRRYQYDDVQRTSPLPPYDLRTDTIGLAIDWEF